MKNREEAARFVEEQFEAYGSTYECPLDKPHAWHYGKQDVRALLDFIYEGHPHGDEFVRGKSLRNGRKA